MSYIVKQSTPSGKIHIHIATSYYDKEKKSSRNSREYIGMLDSTGTELILGENKKDPTEEILKLLKAKGIKYTGKRSTGPGRKKLPIKNLQSRITSATIKETGVVKAFQHIAKEIGLIRSLNKGFGSELGNTILDLASFQAYKGEPLYLAEIWADSVGIKRGLSASSITRITTGIGDDTQSQNSFYKYWFKECGDPKSLIHDTTSLSTYSDRLDEGEWGYNRDKEKLKQINMALVASEENLLPLWYRILPGSIPDVSSLKLTGEILKSLGLNDFSYSLDRGYYSNQNLQDMLDMNIDFTIGIPLHITKAKEIIKSNYKSLLSTKNSFLCNGKRMRSIDCIFNVEMPNKTTRELNGTLFYSPDKHELSAAHFEKVILELEEKANRNEFKIANDAKKWISDNATSKLAAYLGVKKIDEKWRVTRKPNIMNKTIQNFGLFLVVSSLNKMSPEQTLNNYRCRDVAEKIFNIVKNDVGEKRIKTGKSKSVHGRLFIAFIATILRAAFQNKLKEANLLNKYSVNEAIALLAKIKEIELNNEIVRVGEIPKKTRIIQKAIGFEV